MSPLLITVVVGLYFVVLIGISYFTSRDSTSKSFYTGDKKSPWYIVAFGMIGASLSGITFISVPGWVETSQFAYMQMVLGYVVGYAIIATVLMPIYYRLNLTSIYGYLEQRFGKFSYKTGSAYFLLSRIIGASFRLYLVAMVFQYGIFDRLGWDVPFGLTVFITILLIWLYTFKGGIKTIIWTDTLQTLFMLLAVGFTIYLIGEKMNMSFGGMIDMVGDSKYGKMFFFDDFNDKRHFIKQFISGIFISIVMTGLDQDMMQKNLSCKNIKEAKTNMFSFSIVLVFVNFMFLFMGALLYIFANKNGIEIPEKGDQMFPMIAIDGYLGIGVSLVFILGLVAAAYSSADSALTALTTSVCVDFLKLDGKTEEEQKKTRLIVHILISIVLILVIMLFKVINDDSIISQLFTWAGFTYGPLLGLYSFGIFTKIQVEDKYVPFVCVAAPVICILLKMNSEDLLNGYKFGFELLIVNGLLTFIGLLILTKKSIRKVADDNAIAGRDM